MEKCPAFQLYAQDFLTGVMYLTNEEVGIYIKILCKQWTDKTIPKKRLGLLVGLEWENFSDELKLKFQDCGEYVVNKRLEEVRKAKENFAKKQSENGKKGGRPSKMDENKKPNKSQKKPLEDRRVKSEEEEIEKEEGNAKGSVPEYQEFEEYAFEKAEELQIELDPVLVKAKYNAWKVAGWRTGGSKNKGGDRKIKNWKSTLWNTINYLKKEKENGNRTAKGKPDITNLKRVAGQTLGAFQPEDIPEYLR